MPISKIVFDLSCLQEHLDIINENGTEEEKKQVVECIKKHELVWIKDNGKRYAKIPNHIHEIVYKYKKDRRK